MDKIAAGIDLGTTYSAIAIINQFGKPEVVANSEGEPITPSAVYFDGDGVVVGTAAKDSLVTDPGRVATFFKRDMGSTEPAFYVGERGFTPTDLSAEILRKLKRDAEATLGRPVPDVVITVPAYFHNAQREATVEAGRRAGFNVLRTINEPTAAAIAYGVLRGGKGEKLLVFDLGGGTFDVTLLLNNPDGIEVLGTDGDHRLGGKDWDDRLLHYASEQFRAAHGTDPLQDAALYPELQKRAEEAKRTLSQRSKTHLAIQCGGVMDRIEISLAKFEELTQDLLARTQDLCRRMLEDTKYTLADIDRFLLVGGSTRMPQVPRMLQALTGKTPLRDINPDQCVALGAAVQAGLELGGEEERRTGRRSHLLSVMGDRKIQDVASHSLGLILESADRKRYVNGIVLPKNTKIPTSMTKPSELATRPGTDNVMDVYLLQGESEVPRDNEILGLYKIRQIPHCAHGAVIEVTYSYNSSGILEVAAREATTGKILPIERIEKPGDLSWVDLPPVKIVARAEVSVYLLIDCSYSMEGQCMEELKRGARKFVDESDFRNQSIGIICFGDKPDRRGVPTGEHAWVAQGLSKNAKELMRVIEEIQVGGLTPMTEALELAERVLAPVPPPKAILLFTDGVPDNEDNALRAAGQCKASGLSIIACGTAGASKQFLDRVATDEKHSFFSQVSDLGTTFGTIARELGRPGGKLRVT